MFINGRSETSLGVSLARLSGWSDGPTLLRDVTALPNLLGGVPAAFGSVKPRTITATFNLRAATLAERETKLATFREALAGLLTLRFDSHPTRVIRAIEAGVTVAGVSERTTWTVPTVLVTVTFLATDGAAYDAEPIPLAIGATPVPVVVGTLPSPGVLLVTGALANGVSRTVTYRGANGIAYGTLTITPPITTTDSLGASDWLEVNLLRRTLVKVSGGVRTSVYHWKSAGAWFAPDPADADRDRGAWPTLAIGSGAASYIYRPAWAL